MKSLRYNTRINMLPPVTAVNCSGSPSAASILLEMSACHVSILY